MRKRMLAFIASLFLVVAGAAAVSTATTAPAHADGCYTWSGTLKEGASGTAVKELQIRVAGFAGYGTNMGIDGKFGPQTKTAVKNFQAAYGLSSDGVAGSKTFAKIYDLQKSDCSPAHFSWSEVDGG
ncbi:MAG: peptidoglycan-binding protein, partial [Nocardioides sp.]|nr:peptidoglycan-binding protein [Nocardioides sp.]